MTELKTKISVKKSKKSPKKIMKKSPKKIAKKSSPKITENNTGVDIIRFYSKSRHTKALHGTGEQNQTGHDYSALDNVPDWRKVLSNFHVCPFKYNGHTYRTIEHVFQAEKIRLVDPKLARRFTVESGDPIGQGDGAVAQANRKLVILPAAKLKQWSQISDDVMASAARKKFKQCKAAREILLMTWPAQLWHTQLRKKPVRFVHLEEIRDKYLRKFAAKIKVG
jgi:ribA/ribD-fused uncharacterized protein